MSIARLRLEGIRMSYAGRAVLGGSGEIVGLGYEFFPGVTSIMGGNGTGKSTLLRLGALLEEPEAGRVRYLDEGGAELQHDISLRRSLTLVLPRASLFNASVFDNVAYGLKVRGVSRTEVRQRVEEMLEAVGLLEKIRDKAHTLSSGQAQRVSLARALVLRPEVLMLDEPTASVDEENEAIIEGLIRTGLTGQASKKPIVILTTHDRAQAERLADTRLLLKAGALTELA